MGRPSLPDFRNALLPALQEALGLGEYPVTAITIETDRQKSPVATVKFFVPASRAEAVAGAVARHRPAAEAADDGAGWE